MADKHPSLIQMFAERAKRLYSPRAVAMEVLKLSHHPQVDAKLLTTQIARDPALAARLLRVVNSSLFATRDEIVDLDQAVALLGVKTLRMLVLGFAIPDSMFDEKYDEALQIYWRFTAIKAIAAKAIFEIIWRRSSDDALVAGLLHDLGSLVLVNELGDEYAEFLGRSREDGCELNALENQILGFEHIVLSARLLSHWGLPDELTRAIGMPLDVERLAKLPEGCNELPQVLHLADLTARFLMKRDGNLLRQLMQVAKRYRRATAVHVEAVVEAVKAAEAPLMQAFGQTPSGEDFVAILQEAQAQLEYLDDPVIEREFWDHDRPDFARLLERARQLAARMEFVEEVASLDSSEECEPQPTPRRNQALKDRLAKASPDEEAEASTSTALLPLASALTADLEPIDLDVAKQRLQQWLARARNNRVPVSLVMIHLDVANIPRGLQAVIRQRFNSLVSARFRGEAARLSPDGSMYVAAMERLECVDAARDILQGLANDGHCHAAIAKIGIASIDHPPPNFPATEWFDSAHRCLYAANCMGGNAIKSIDAV